jgi:putative heme-binding domain-containing protein
MTRGWFIGLFGLAFLLVGESLGPWDAQAQQKKKQADPKRSEGVNWIWFDEGDPGKSAPAETRYFRKVFTMARPFVDEAELDITADNEFTVWVNGAQVGRGKEWKRIYRFDVKKHIVNGQNVVAVRAHNTEGAAGLLVRLGYVPNGQSRTAVTSDSSWKSSKTAPEGWQKVDFDDAAWKAVKVIGPVGKAGPWKDLVWDAGGDDRFAVPLGFRVETVIPPNPQSKNLDPKLPFSLVNMTFDAKGRLLVSQERGPVLLCTEPNKDGILQSIKPYCSQVTNCQGMCWVKDALLLVGNGPKGTGLYRVRDTKGVDQTDEVTLLHKFNGGMGEHGPHAILHGPDGWLYLVIGNHAHASLGPNKDPNPEKLAANSPLTRWPTGDMGPDQGKAGTTEDVLLPRLNDARGHAANILAPGGTIWRLDHEGKNMSLVTAGFRNHFDAAFSPTGELFTFDSDMEWDEALPWYRAVRVCHCPPGADFVWRTGAANTPNYYIDSLPPLHETGRGSPVGLEFYDHHVFPEKYRGAFFMADWSLGIIYAVILERDGATYKAKEVERFCTGNPMNVTDLEVGPDGAIYFTLGGRGTQGGVYRIVYPEGASKSPAGNQPLAAWSRAAVAPQMATATLEQLEKGTLESAPARIRGLDLLQMHGHAPNAKLLIRLSQEDKDALVRAHAVYLLGVNGYKDGRETLIKSLKDADPLVRRRACEALIRAGFEPPVEAIYPLLGDKDKFVRTAARLVIQRIDPKKWADRLWKEPNDLIAFEGIIALCKINQAAPYAEPLFGRLRGASPKDSAQLLLDYLRTVEMALIHVTQRPIWLKAIAEQCIKLFPHKDWRINRELAILLTDFRRENLIDEPVQGKLLSALTASKDDRMQQIHYFYCMRLLKDGWTPAMEKTLTTWYESTKIWQGGHSFTPFLENIYRECLDGFSVAARKQLLEAGDQMPLAALVLAQKLQTVRQLELLPALHQLSTRLAKIDKLPRGDELKQAVSDALARTALSQPTAENWPYLVSGLASPNKLLKAESLSALRKLPTKPKPDDPIPYRSLIAATPTLSSPAERWQAIELLRQWNGRSFGADKDQWEVELKSWAKWFNQTFPKEPPLANVTLDKPAESKYKFEDLLAFLEKDPLAQKGDVERGRKVFEKAQCLKCHKYGKEGEGLGPDLTTLSKRFKRIDVLESIIYPSKVISDQYRSVVIVTTKGQQITGLAAPQGDTVTVLQSDGTKVTLKKDEIEQQLASLISVMPEKLLDPLTKEEIADLFAFLESTPK